MKKSFTLLLLAFFSLPMISAASTVSMSPTSVTLNPGQSVTLTIIVDPQGTAYTAKVSLSFPPNLLSVASFSQAGGWIPLSQPGYDSVDNSSGSLVKTGGATGGFSSPKVFGTVTFTSKAHGTATISVTGATQVLDANNQNTFTGGGQTTINISAPAAPIVAPYPTPVQNTTKPTSPVRKLMQTPKASTAATSTATTTVAAATSTEAAEAEEEENLIAAASSVDISNLALIIMSFLVTFSLGFLLGKKGI